MNFAGYLKALGLKKNSHLMLHSSFRAIRHAFSGISPEDVIAAIEQRVSNEGSLIIPSFTYCFSKGSSSDEVFDRLQSRGKTGALSEAFRQMPGVVRTSSPTHSFLMWGRIAREIPYTNSPESPLGKDSIPDWLTKNMNSFVMLLGPDFTSLSYGHYLEVMAPVPWAGFSPWDHMGVLPIGLSTEGNLRLKELPGCSGGFTSFEKYLLEKKLIKISLYHGLRACLVPVEVLYRYGIEFFREQPSSLLHQKGICRACDARWERVGK